MAEYSLNAKARNVVGKEVRTLRREGFVPGVIYGPKTDPVHVQFNYRDVQVALMNAGGTNIIDIEVEDDKVYPVLARDVQRDVIRGDILHVDFFAVDMQTKIRADIPVVLLNESPIVASRKGILITGTNTVTIETLPSKLLNSVEVDLATLEEMGDTIYISDLQLDEEISIINDPDEMLAKVVQPSAARAEEMLEMLDGEVEEGEMPEVVSDEDEEYEGEEGDEDEE